MSVPRIQFSGVSKRFQAVRALHNVTFAVQPTEFHALCGENGAGKSTLMKILSGGITDYEGTIKVDGSPLQLLRPRDAELVGIGIIHQELNLVNHLSVAANIFLGREKLKGGLWLDEATMEREAAALLAQLECTISPNARVGSLRIGDQQLVEVAKALSLQARILIMDEPTSALTESEVARLFRVIGRLRSSGVTIIYISHKMDEIFGYADRITVLRDGEVVRSLDRAETSPAEVTRLMVGRELGASQRNFSQDRGQEILRVENLSLPWPGHARRLRLSGISFEVHAGEVVGIAGLMGAGRTELLECLFGSSPQTPSGAVYLQNQRVAFANPAEALAAGVAMVTEDRKHEGVIAAMNVREHITLSSLGEAAVAGLIAPAREKILARDSITQLRIKTAGPEASISSLSGGNQQKCLIARALRTQPRLLLLDDPTRGIDVGAKAEIYRLIDELCQQGLALIITSSELPELMAVCDRILVLCEGRLTAELSRSEFSEEALMLAATGTAAASV